MAKVTPRDAIKLEERVQLFQDVATFVTNNQIPVRMVCINVERHRAKYLYPTPAYKLGLMLILERFCEYLDTRDDLGLVFGDHEADEVSKGVVDFSGSKSTGKTPMYFGRPIREIAGHSVFHPLPPQPFPASGRLAYLHGWAI